MKNYSHSTVEHITLQVQRPYKKLYLAPTTPLKRLFSCVGAQNKKILSEKLFLSYTTSLDKQLLTCPVEILGLKTLEHVTHPYCLWKRHLLISSILGRSN